MKNVDLTGKTAFDANSLNALKIASKENSPEAIKEAAKQFEAVLMNMMLKSMREATPQDSPFDNEQSRTFTAMLDQQLSSNLANKGLGLADILAKQLTKGANLPNNVLLNSTMEQAVSAPESATTSTTNAVDEIPSYFMNQANGYFPKHLSTQQTPHGTDNKNNTNSREPVTQNKSLTTNGLLNFNGLNSGGFNPLDKTTQTKTLSEKKPVSANTADFKNRMVDHAEEASRATGIPSKLMLGQAALESGWGKREIKGKDGTPSYNLFGIKATPGWTGKTVETTTTEYVNGVKQKHVTKFRAYDSYADSFKDFAKLMQNNPRYQQVMSNLHSVDNYAQAMQKAGYATDPNYATKLASVINKVSTT